MCRNTECADREMCYRYRAKPTEYWQAWFVDSPTKDKDDKCAYKLDIMRNDRLKSLERCDEINEMVKEKKRVELVLPSNWLRSVAIYPNGLQD